MAELDDEITNEIFLQELKQEFYDTAARNMQEMEDLFQTRGWPRLAEIAHDIKGTAGLFGYDEGSRLADQVVIAARKRSRKKVRTALERLKKYLKKNKIIGDPKTDS